ncbi:MAG: hypothetical protein ACI9DC_000661 [Gammaproteobacteria bacterium]
MKGVLMNVCPNCGGGFVPRPHWPSTPWREGGSLHNQPATTQRKHKPVDAGAHREFVAAVSAISLSKH